MSRRAPARRPYEIGNLDEVMPESRQFDVGMWARRRMAHLTPFFLRCVRAKTGCPKTFRQPHGAIMEQSHGSPVCLSAEGRGCNAAKFSCGYPASVTRDPVGGAHSRAFCLRRPASFRLSFVHPHVRAASRRSRTAVRRRSRSVYAHDAACVGAVGAAWGPATSRTKCMNGRSYLAESVMMQHEWNLFRIDAFGYHEGCSCD
jgi:hypothetical protein